jgi:hypothetical protein
MTATPECDRMIAVADDSHKLGDFLDWLNEQDIHLATWERTKVCGYGSGLFVVSPGGGVRDVDGLSQRKWRCVGGRMTGHPDSNKPGEDDGDCPECGGTGRVERVEPRMILTGEPFERLLARYFGIDLDKVETERRQVLAALNGDAR